MKRFIRYLYEYEYGKRIRNVGFVKVEAGDEETIVHMQAKGFQDSGDRKLVLYLFCEENEQIIGIRQTEVRLTSPVLSQHLTYTADSVRGVSGVAITTESGRQIAATWDDRPVDVGKMMESVPETDTTGPEEENCWPGPVEVEEYDSQVGNFSMWERKLTKIQRKDISRLPRCEWKLANNQFLIHGYNNYHHLLLISEGNYLKLGVPGIYHIKEAKFADMFGFEEFLSAEELGILPDAEEEDQRELFGYWCRPVRGQYHLQVD